MSQKWSIFAPLFVSSTYDPRFPKREETQGNTNETFLRRIFGQKVQFVRHYCRSATVTCQPSKTSKNTFITQWSATFLSVLGRQGN